MTHIEKLLKNLFEILGENLKSVFIYGSSLKSDTKDNINLMVIMGACSGDILRECSPAVKNWIKAGNPPPVFITLDEWCSSTDSYAMEYSDIIDCHKIIYGDDYISELNIERDDLRLQCEIETKNLLMRLRNFYLLNADSKVILKECFIPAAKTFLTIFRTVLRLNHIAAGAQNEEVILAACDKAGISSDVFIRLLNYKTKKTRIARKDIHNTLDELLCEVSKLLYYVNSL